MNRMLRTLPPALLAAALLAACGRGAPAESAGPLSGLADQVAADIREELASQNLGLGHGRSNLPDAEISPQGDLIIDGQPVPLDPKQRELALAYRNQLAMVAETGARVGLEGAELAGKAMKEAAKAALSGDEIDVEARIEAEADAVRESAKALCEHLPALHAAQQELAAAVPEFAPYATMDRKEYDDCRAEVAKS
jgi:hypothetical protein